MEYVRFFPNLQGGMDYIKEAEKQLRDNTVYEEINYNKKILSQLVDSCNKYFKKLNSDGYISYKEKKYFKYKYQKKHVV